MNLASSPERHARKLLTIIAEAVLERVLIEDCLRLGALGYTVLDVRGGGPGGERPGQWEAERSIEMQVVCTDEVAQSIAAHVLRTHAPDYAVRIFLSDVTVFRQAMF
ncbi:MAG: P-II family nitrogen regulator [Burkholderiales bacterium]|jgi:nitrogen regulatory protein P-II 2